MSDLRELPSVDQLLQTEPVLRLVSRFGRSLTVEAIRTELARIRQEALQQGKPLPGRENLLGSVEMTLTQWVHLTLVPVINATGVVIHTNLGRAPLSKAAQSAILSAASGYNTLEYDLSTGKRGLRSMHAENLLRRLTGAEAAFVVNNNAAALLVCLSTLARRKRTLIARSQLVEVGGGFRIPDVMKQSGTNLVEVGTTNRVHLRDFEEALAEPTGLVVRAHHSNFRIIGFTTEPELADVAALAHAKDALVLDDLGSGALLNTEQWGLAHEPTVQESLQAGADLVCFSGDKLLGGPQAGIILGKEALVEKIRRHPLSRAIRADKLCLAALSATLVHYLRDEADREVPIWQMISMPGEQIKTRALRWQDALGHGEVIPGRSTIGGGSLPEETLPTWLLSLDTARPNRFMDELRKANPPVIARIEENRVVLDPRTVLPDQDGDLLSGVSDVLKKIGSNQ